MDSELQKLQLEIDTLKRKKERQMLLSNSMREKEKLLGEIKQLEATSKSPSKLKSFGRTFGMGLKKSGKFVWKAVKSGSRNLERNSPELREINMNNNGSVSNLTKMYLPKQKKMKPKKSRRMKMIKPRRINIMKPNTSSLSWGLP